MWELIAKFAMPLIDKLIPDPAAKAAAQFKLLELQQSGQFKQMESDLTAMTMQADINKIEAASPSLFKSGWRPATGWVCVLAMTYQYVVNPLLSWASASAGWPPPPKLDLDQVLALFAPLLGLGVYRTVEKVKGVA